MRALQKLVRNGNATQITIPRQMLIALGWLPGDAVIVELLEDNTLRARPPVERDVAPVRKPRLIYDDAPAGAK